MVQLNVNRLAILLVKTESERHTRGKVVLQPNDGDLVLWRNQVIVLGVSKCERKHTLLLEVCLMNTGKRLDNHGNTTKVSNFEGSMLTRRSLAVVFVTNNNPLNALGFVISRRLWNCLPCIGQAVEHLVGFSVGRVNGTNQHVVGNVVEVASVFEPWTGHRDVVCGALALDLDENISLRNVLAVPLGERGEEFEAL